MASAPTRYHVSLDVADQPGVLATVADEFAEHESASRRCARTARGDGDGDARLVLVTHEAPDAALAATVEVLSGLDAVRGVESVVRVEDLGRTAPEVGT